MNDFPRLLAFDLDDTLLAPRGELTPRTIDALVACHARGTVVALASGRMLPTMLPIAAALPFAPALVSYNGAQVNLVASEPPLYHRPVSAELSGRVIDLAQERGLHLNFYCNDLLFVTSVNDWESRIYREQTGARLEYEPNFNNLRGLEPTKLIIIDEAQNIARLWVECQALFHAELTVTRSKPIYLEFLHPSVNKGVGFAALCDALQIGLNETAAFGDAYNDIEMLQAAGTAVVVENGIDEVKAIADIVCASNDEDGVAQLLESWLAAFQRRAVEAAS